MAFNRPSGTQGHKFTEFDTEPPLRLWARTRVISSTKLGAVEHCDECGFDYDLETLRPIDVLLREALEPYAVILKTDAAVLRRSPAPDVWSALEYASHVRDDLLVQREKVLRALVESMPTFVPMHRDERVELEHQNEQEPARVAEQLASATELLTGLFAVLDDDQLERTGIYNYPAPQERSIRWIGVHTLHECRHHLLDIEKVLELARERSGGRISLVNAAALIREDRERR